MSLCTLLRAMLTCPSVQIQVHQATCTQQTSKLGPGHWLSLLPHDLGISLGHVAPGHWVLEAMTQRLKGKAPL